MCKTGQIRKTQRYLISEDVLYKMPPPHYCDLTLGKTVLCHPEMVLISGPTADAAAAAGMVSSRVIYFSDPKPVR